MYIEGGGVPGAGIAAPQAGQKAELGFTGLPHAGQNRAVITSPLG